MLTFVEGFRPARGEQFYNTINLFSLAPFVTLRLLSGQLFTWNPFAFCVEEGA
jgi:hypothetical protein